MYDIRSHGLYEHQSSSDECEREEAAGIARVRINAPQEKLAEGREDRDICRHVYPIFET